VSTSRINVGAPKLNVLAIGLFDTGFVQQVLQVDQIRLFVYHPSTYS
jgi:hypothetical protein